MIYCLPTFLNQKHTNLAVVLKGIVINTSSQRIKQWVIHGNSTAEGKLELARDKNTLISISVCVTM